MRRYVATLVPVLLLAAALLTSCAGRDPLADVLVHQEAIVDLLERHAEDPAAAAQAVTSYLADHEAELTSALSAARALHDELADDPRAVADLAVAHQEALRRIGERTLALRKNLTLMAEPAVQAALDRVLRGD
ncbi:MAG: hypothetical protein EP329_16390 [Deltaproteobacteria bacterium]|nr:MAG: hypothetical protein EP329_16390 [Deltaproteobacteria bacterium]